jgi:hypothetical protein
MSAEPESSPRSRRRLAWPLVTLGLIALAVILFILISPLRDRQGRDAGAVAGGTPEARLRVTQARPLGGTNLVEIDIGTGDYGRGSFGSSGDRLEQRNILLLDRTTGAARRLLPDNGRTIEQAWFLPAQADYVTSSTDAGMPADEDSPPPAYFVLLVAQADHDRRSDLLVGSLAGPEQRFVMQGIEGVDALWMQSPTRIGLLVRERLNLFYRIIDVPTLRVVQQHQVAIGQ